MAEKVISERVVSRTVKGSTHPIAQKFRKFKGSIGGVCIAPVLILIAFGLLFYGEKFKRDSQIVEELSLEDAVDVRADSGMHKITGKPQEVEAVTPDYVNEQVGEVLYYNLTLEEYKTVEETERETITKVEDGKEVEEVIEREKEVDKWVEVESQNEWASFSLGNYTIEVTDAKKELNITEKEFYEEYAGFVDITSKSITPDIGDRRIVIEYVEIDDDLIVVGEISGNTISQGEVFIISNKSDQALLNDLKTGENMMFWVMKIGSWLLLTVGFLSLVGPILSLVDFIPLAGKAANCVASVIAGVLALFIILFGTFIIRFWYVCIALVILLVIGLAVLVFVLVKNKKPEKDEKTDSKKK